ncbi:PepSY domain-containing protein [Aestuariibacter salexigens]|uniref:PepSY domain-containing protein n=1 Tax=Aestuariibacter salexigens TaxID=226010 RepID=UPI00047ED158
MGVSKLFAAVLLLIGILSAPGAMAQQKETQKPTLIDKAEAARQARKEVNGRVLKVDQNHDRYRVKVLKKSGRVVSVDVDKKSGKVTKKDEEHQ